jgi:hypothetical protein
MFAALGNSHDSEDINKTWENSEGINKPSAKEVYVCMNWNNATQFGEECLRFLGQRM